MQQAVDKTKEAEYLRARMEEYKSDPYIKGCMYWLEKIITIAKPIIRISPRPHESVFEIDPEYKEAIRLWKERITDHIKSHYPEINREGYIEHFFNHKY